MALLSSGIVAAISSTPIVTKSLTALTIASSLLYFYLSYTKSLNPAYFLVEPGSTLFHPWTLLTSCLIEPTVLELVFTLICIPPSLRYLERLWGSIEMLKFIAVTVGFSNIIAFGFNWIEFIATRDAELFLYGMRYHGQMSLQTGILVAFTQLIPEHQVQLFGIFKARVKAGSLPMAYLTLSTVLCIFGWQDPWIIIQFAWFVSWIYLRFYKRHTSDLPGGMDTYGDRSETFSLVSWFPPPVHYPLTILGNTVHSVATRFHLIPHAPRADLESGSYMLNQAPGTARAEAERRRAMALKALDQRVANTATPPPGANGNASSSTSSPPQVNVPRVPPPVADPSPPAPERSNSNSKSAEAGDTDSR
ncbi:Eukaryotic integral membrane protein [Mycena kentingensis (nom. inval.)]|nr:Eukaryotic integral membrane protein [Mycena kentingensis (nom. inval.)]